MLSCPHSKQTVLKSMRYSDGKGIGIYICRRWKRKVPCGNRPGSTGGGRGQVVIIQFLKGKGLQDSEFLRRMEPEIKLFRFEKSDENFEELPEERKQEEIRNIKNGLNFAKKVLSTGECDLLILDEVLGLVEKGIVSVEELKAMLDCREDTSVILTGITLSDEICLLADEISKIETVKFKVWD